MFPFPFLSLEYNVTSILQAHQMFICEFCIVYLRLINLKLLYGPALSYSIAHSFGIDMALEIVQSIPWRHEWTHILPIQEDGMTSKHMYNIGFCVLELKLQILSSQYISKYSSITGCERERKRYGSGWLGLAADRWPRVSRRVVRE